MSLGLPFNRFHQFPYFVDFSYFSAYILSVRKQVLWACLPSPRFKHEECSHTRKFPPLTVTVSELRECFESLASEAFLWIGVCLPVYFLHIKTTVFLQDWGKSETKRRQRIYQAQDLPSMRDWAWCLCEFFESETCVWTTWWNSMSFQTLI